MHALMQTVKGTGQMTDRFASYQPGLNSPADHAFAIAPADGADLPQVPRAIYVGAAGSLSGVMLSGEAISFSTLQAGMIYPLRLARVQATGTTATGLVGLY